MALKDPEVPVTPLLFALSWVPAPSFPPGKYVQLELSDLRTQPKLWSIENTDFYASVEVTGPSTGLRRAPLSCLNTWSTLVAMEITSALTNY